MFRLDSKLALLNGAGRGVGLGQQLAQQGAYVSVNDFHVEGGPGGRPNPACALRAEPTNVENSADENILGLHREPRTDKSVAYNELPR